MKKKKSKPLLHILNVLTVALIIESFLCSMMLVRVFVKDDCLDRIEETAGQVGTMFDHAMRDRQEKLAALSNILAANNENSDNQLQAHMASFCQTQGFAALCIHQKDGSVIYYGDHPHEAVTFTNFEQEVARLPYTSNVFSSGDLRAEKFIYQAVKIEQQGQILGVLYGYTALDALPNMLSSAAYDGKAQFYLLDGSTGEYMVDEYHRYRDGVEQPLLNLDDPRIAQREAQAGYHINDMRYGLKNGESGYFVFRPSGTDAWYYTYYMPLSTNNWSLQITVDEATAFASYIQIRNTMLHLMVVVIALMFAHILVLMLQGAHANRRDKARLHQTVYINEVQRALINAHNNPDFVDRALKIVGHELQAETVLLLSFSDQTCYGAHYWPSKDKAQAMNLVGRNIRDDFPTLFDLLSAGTSVLYDSSNPADVMAVSETARAVFTNFEVARMALVPVMDTIGILKGAIAAVNMADPHPLEKLECVTYDFFMAITNLESHTIIKNMGAMDYLTGVKNRNSYEAELSQYTALTCKNLWCMFLDVNGLHEVNNTKGHKAGDIMLRAVADAIKRVFGEAHTYRMGGDEFVAFATDSTQKELLKKKKAILAELASKGYAASAGFEGTEKTEAGIFDVEGLVAAAETIMYREKKEYYTQNDLPLDRGHIPAQV